MKGFFLYGYPVELWIDAIPLFPWKRNENHPIIGNNGVGDVGGSPLCLPLQTHVPARVKGKQYRCVTYVKRYNH
jgi:hypothetical protein